MSCKQTERLIVVYHDLESGKGSFRKGYNCKYAGLLCTAHSIPSIPSIHSIPSQPSDQGQGKGEV